MQYDRRVVGKFEADLFVEGTVIVELKSVRTLAVAHEIQLVNYLKATGTEVGLVINFGESKVEVKRKVRDLSSISAHSVASVLIPVNPVNPVKK